VGARRGFAGFGHRRRDPSEESLPSGLLPEIQEALEESASLYPVDLVDLTTASDAFRARVLAEGLPWTD